MEATRFVHILLVLSVFCHIFKDVYLVKEKDGIGEQIPCMLFQDIDPNSENVLSGHCVDKCLQVDQYISWSISKESVKDIFGGF